LGSALGSHTIPRLSECPRCNSEGCKRQAHRAFTDIAQKAGLTAPVIFGGENTKKYIIETTGPASLSSITTMTAARLFRRQRHETGRLPSGKAPTSHLYRNNRDGTFTDVTEKAGLTHSGWARAFASGL